MTRGGNRKRRQSLRKSTDENDHFQTGQGEEIGPSPAQCTSLRRGKPEEFIERNPSNTGHGRQNPSVNSKKKPDSEDKEEDAEEEEEDEEEEEEIPTALDNKEVSHVHVDMDACDHSKQGLESEIAPETQNDPESDTDGCDPSKKAFNKTEVFDKNFDIDANDQSKQGPEPEIDTENQQGAESEVTEGGDTSTNKPGDNIGTEVISLGEGGSDDNSDRPTVLQSNPPLNGKALLYH
jgi:hypothetical protein